MLGLQFHSYMRMAFAAALMLGAYAASTSPAKADLEEEIAEIEAYITDPAERKKAIKEAVARYLDDEDADLEERVAELEATTVRKGNRQVSLTISGWVTKSTNYWDDGELSDTWWGDKDADLTSRFAVTGDVAIANDWSAGYNFTMTVPGDFTGDIVGGNVFGITSNQFAQDSVLIQGINTLYSYMYLDSKFGTLNWGYLSPATDNVAVLVDQSGTVIESNAVFFEGPGFSLRPEGVTNNNNNNFNPKWDGMLQIRWEQFLWCETINAGIGADCNGAPASAIRYDSPTIAGFTVTSSWGEDDFYDVALRYAGEFGGIRVAAAGGYTHTTDERELAPDVNPSGTKENTDLYQVGAYVSHIPTGLFVYGMYQNEDADTTPRFAAVTSGGQTGSTNETDVWYLKAGIKQGWFSLGNTVLYGEYGQYHNQFGGLKGVPLCASGAFTTFGGQQTPSCLTAIGLGEDLVLTGSRVDRWGLGAVQEVDAAAMHIYLRYQNQSLNTDLRTTVTNTNVNQGWEDWHLI